MELSIIKEPKLVVAIDIGSTYSGYAWQWRIDFINNRSNVEFNTNWGAGALQLHKTSTCVLLDTNFKVDSFGHVAETRFRNCCERAGSDKCTIRGHWFFFKRFKLFLYDKHFKEDLLIEDFLGQKRPIMEVMSSMIGALKDHFLKNLDDKGHQVNLAETLWVVTVPAIWTDKAKKFMRDAAEKSGIDKKHLLLAHEPESAALYCMHLPSEQRKEMNNFGGKGDKFITVDLGGGTVDILAIEVLEDGNVKEVCAGAGNRVGGDDVNIAFFQSCRDTIEGWHNLGDKDVEDILTMEKDFEDRKVQIGSDDNEEDTFIIHIPDSMVDGSVTVRAGLEDSKYFKPKKRRLSIDSKFVRDVLFRKTVKLVLVTIEDILKHEEVREVRTLVLVGGFSESGVVVQKIREVLSTKYPNIKVVVPTSPFRAVLKGAVLFGHDPLIFQSRISRATFGIATNDLFDPKKHDEAKRWKHDEDGKDYCKDIFDIHVQKDKPVKLMERQPSVTYYPMYKGQTTIGLPIYSSQNVTPNYTTDSDCKQIGKIRVDMPDTTGGRNRKVKVEMVYGGTELSVIATDESTKNEYPAEIKFDSI